MTPEEIFNAWQSGKTMEDIGLSMNPRKNKNQIVGILYRYRKNNNINIPRNNKRSSQGSQKAERIIYRPAAKKKPAETTGFLKVLENNLCRFISGDVRERTAEYCTHKAHRKGFCEEHYALCYRKPEKEKVNTYIIPVRNNL